MLKLPIVLGLLLLAVQQLYPQTSATEYSDNFRFAWIPVNGEEYNKGVVSQSGLDIDKDGWGEFIASDEVWGLHLIFEAYGDDKYKEVYSFEAQEQHAWIEDFNGDGSYELLKYNSGIWSMYQWDGQNLAGENGKGFQSTPIMEVTVLPDLGPIFACTDLDLDGNLEIVTAHSGSASRRSIVEILEIDASNWPHPTMRIAHSSPEVGGYPSYNTRMPGYSDVNKDGYPELLIGMNESRVLTVVTCTGNDTYAPDIQIKYPSNMLIELTDSPLAADVNHDGKEEIYLGDLDGKFFIIQSTGSLASTFTVENTKYLCRIVPQYASGPGEINMCLNGRLGDQGGDGVPDFYYSAKDNKSLIDVEYRSGDVADSNSYAINYTHIVHPTTGKEMRFSIRYIGQGPRGRVWDVDMDKDQKREVVASTWDSDGGIIQGWPCLIVFESKTEIETGVNKAKINSQLKTFELTGAYPNPFNASTRIVYELATRTELRLSIFDMAGREIAILDAGVREAGKHEMIWNANQLPSGIYLIFLQSESIHQIRKSILVR